MVSLVGYTNAGKSTLFNALSGAGVFAKDMLFATLDPTLRRVKFADGGAFILSDTVGFISDLPTQLISAFHATLEEIVDADLILHVRDIAAASSEAQRTEVLQVLSEIGVNSHDQSKRVIEVWNKADLLPEEERTRHTNRAVAGQQSAALVSAATGQGLTELVTLIRDRLFSGRAARSVIVEHSNGSLIHWLYENTEVLDRRDQEDGNLHFEVRVASERERDLDRRLQQTSP